MLEKDYKYYKYEYEIGYKKGLRDMAEFCSSLMDDPSYYLEPEKLLNEFEMRNTTYSG